MSEESRAFWSVIPATVLDDMSIPANAKILYGVLSGHMRKCGYCWRTNAELAAEMHCSEDSASRLVTALYKAGHIRVFVLPNRKSGGSIRRIYPALPEPVLDEDEEGYSAKMPSTYSAKKPRVPGKNAESIMYINNNKKKIEKEKAQSAFAAAASLLSKCDTYGHEVAEALQRFLQMRAEIKKPVKSKQAATMLWNRLLNLSNGDAAQMVRLLDKATEHQWLSLYPLKEDELPQQSATVDTGGMRVL